MFDELVVPPVIVLVVFVHTSATRVPKVESERVGEAQTCAADRLLSNPIAPVIVPVEEVTSAVVASGDTALVNCAVVASGASCAVVASAAMSVHRIVSVFDLIPVTFVQSIVSVFVLIAVTSPQAIVSVFALIKPFEVTSPVTSAQEIESVFVLMPVMFPVPISLMRVAAFDLIVAMSVQLILSVFVLTRARIAEVASGETAEVNCAVVASGDTAEARPTVVARPDVALVTLVAVASPERSDTRASEPVPNVPLVKLRVP
jgi:hypothetical protein